ncbi:MAG: hypothetical protein ACRCXL_10375 [Dermatophilaceae bacterium]
MRGVGPGTVLGGRYTVRRRLEQRSGTERWDADDTTLGRRVSILAVPADDPRTADLLDAARRAASVSHPVFVRILDVGADPDVAYVVEEDLDDARSLTELVVGGGVPGDEVRRLSGEVAAALETARQRGMHHLDLTPDDVLRTTDGDVRVRGLETAAVRAGADGVDAGEAGRQDALSVVALAYAGLTGLWPLGSGGSGLGVAPRVTGGVAAPSEIAAGVPRDLDALCRLTLNDDHGPTSPGDYARQVAPWPTRQVLGQPIETQAQEDGADPGVLPMAATVVDHHRELVARTGDGAASDDDDEAERSISVENTTGREWTSSASDTSGRDNSGAIPEHTRVLARTAPQAGGPPSNGAPAAMPSASDPPGTGTAKTVGAAAAEGATAATAAVTGALSRVGDRVGGLSRRAANRMSERRAIPAREELAGDRGEQVNTALRETERTPNSASGVRAIGAVWGEPPGTVAVSDPAASDPLVTPAPLAPTASLSRDDSRLAIGIVAGFVILSLFIGIWGVTRIGSGTGDLGFDESDSAPRAASSEPSSAASPSAPPTTASPGSPPPAEPLAVLGVRSYDPEGDGDENEDLTPKAYDGDPSTGWYSDNYRDVDFGGLKKGLGLVVDLGPNKKPRQVRLDIPVANDVQVFLGPDARLDGATKVGERAGARGQISFDVPANLVGQYVIVWYTKMSVDDDGKRRAVLDEVVVTG